MRRRCGHRRRMILGHPRADVGHVTRTRAIAPDPTLDKARATVPDPTPAGIGDSVAHGTTEKGI